MAPRSLLLSALAVLSLGVVSLSAVSPAAAQGTGALIPSLEFQHTDARAALRDLFRMAGVSYTVAPEVQGTVTLSLRNVDFGTALQNLTRQVDATWRVEGGVYQVFAPAPQGPGGAAQPFQGFGGGGFAQNPVGAGEPPTMTVDGSSLYILRRNTVYKIDKRSMKLDGQLTLPQGEPGPGGRGGFRRPGGAG